MDSRKFKNTIWDYYEKSGRHSLPWRLPRERAGKKSGAENARLDPYKVLVSEVMLQQTQVSRVLKKYPEFLASFPTAAALAKASNADVLRAWQGLGYNRRALLLKRAAEVVTRDFGGRFPRTAEELESLPGIGQSTRGALMAFAFGLTTVFIETNIRAVFIHFFFPEKEKAGQKGRRTGGAAVHDRDIIALIEKTLDRENPREWYYALMDYGVHLKQTLPNPSQRSAHHVRQSRFEGSNRQVRAEIVRFVLGKSGTGAKGATEPEIIAHIRATLGDTPHDVRKNIETLAAEGFMKETDGHFRA